MAEAEDVITDAARHATIYARSLWLKHRGPVATPRPYELADISPRLDLLIEALFGVSLPLRIAQPPAIPTLLTRIFRRHDVRPSPLPLPANDGHTIWLPNKLPASSADGALDAERDIAIERFRTLALMQAVRVQRQSAVWALRTPCPRSRALYLLLEAQASDCALVQMLPGMADAIEGVRRWSLQSRPALANIPPASRPIEQWAKTLLGTPLRSPVPGLPEDAWSDPSRALDTANVLLKAMCAGEGDLSRVQPHTHALYKDAWTGDLLTPPSCEAPTMLAGDEPDADREHTPPRSARLPRRPQQRPDKPGEDDAEQGVWMIQTAEPMEKAEDPHGMQRPIDRDDHTGAEDYADALSELDQARLVSSPTPAKEILLSDDPPDKRALAKPDKNHTATAQVQYPEWDYRMQGYHLPGATVHLTPTIHGTQEWIDQTLARHRSMLNTLRRRFEMLRADRQWQRRQLDGDDIDLDAYIEGITDTRSGLPMPQALYRQQRLPTQDLAIMLLVDISGSTDAWLSANQRIIDVEREALLLVAIALEHMGQPYSIQAFSGEGPQGVTVSAIKHFAEPYSNDIALRIASLEPQHYTRSGTALRHATSLLMKQAAQHRLLLLLSDGKPNDADHYEGRYGVEDTRRAVEEARAQGVFPFCLTIDRKAAGYLPRIFGARQYALLSTPGELPAVLLDWMRRLVGGC